jgi:tRNA 5-methylaminomethyl-2-thiouridine biosynthesis bifunctional protein
MHALGGEVTFLPAAEIAGGPRCIVSGDGYVLPQEGGRCVIGSTYAHAAQQASVTDQGVTSNLHRAAGLLNIPELSGRLIGQKLDGWAGWRAVLPGRLPAIGPVRQAPGVWVACGFASRGLTWATLAGDLIAGALNGEPLVLENDIIDAISDN